MPWNGRFQASGTAFGRIATSANDANRPEADCQTFREQTFANFAERAEAALHAVAESGRSTALLSELGRSGAQLATLTSPVGQRKLRRLTVDERFYFAATIAGGFHSAFAARPAGARAPLGHWLKSYDLLTSSAGRILIVRG